MNLQFMLIQILGVVAWFFLAFSYYRNNTNKILVFHLIGSLLYCIHYLFLKAYTGVLICGFETLFDYGYYKTDKDKYIYIASVPIRIICGLLTFYSFIDILPILASLIDGYTLTKKKKIVVFGAIVSYTLWVIYNICVMSYSGAIADAIIVISNLSILLFNNNLFKNKNGVNIDIKNKLRKIKDN